MLRNRHIQIRIARDSANTPVENPKPVVDPEEISRIARNFVKYTATVGVVVIGVAAVFDTLSKMAVIETEAKAKNKYN